MSAELLPCPFCGEAPVVGRFCTESLFSHDIVPYLSISCHECDCAQVEGEQHDEVRAAWNRRAPLSARPDESLGVSQDEQTASLRERDEWKAEYLRRHRDCGDLVEQFGVQHGDLQAAQARIKVLEGALEWFIQHEKSLTLDVQSAHHSRGNGTTQWMTEDDREFRSDLRAAFDTARSALPQLGGENG